MCVDQDGDGVTDCDGDCDDGDPLNLPGGNEICGDGVDNDCDGMADEDCNGGLGTFVSALTGDDANPGTLALPVQTIGQGMTNAVTLGGPQTVVVAEGSYAESITLVEGVDLQGGFHCDTTTCDWSRDPAQYASVIANTDYDGVVAPAGVTRATLVDGFHIVGFDGVPPAPPGSVGVLLVGGSPTLRGNTITGGNVSGGGFAANRSIGVSLRQTTDPAGALLTGNTISGGTSVGLSAGVLFDSYPASTTVLAEVTGNLLRGGTGQRSAGLVAWNAIAGTLVEDNDILAGSSNGGSSDGIEVGGEVTIDGNRINVDRPNVGTCTNPTRWCTGIASESSTTVVTNNIIYGPLGGRTAAVFLGEFEVAAGEVVLNGNTLDGGGSGLSAQPTSSAALVVSIGTCTSCGFNGFVGRVRNNVLAGGNNQNRYGIVEDPAAGRSMRPELIENNLFFFATAASRTDVLYRQMSSGGVPTDNDLTAINALSTPPASGNLAGDPLYDATWHQGAGSPCTDQGTDSEAPATDFEGDPRPAGAVDIGHDEAP